jgi:uncharacterized protein YkwD
MSNLTHLRRAGRAAALAVVFAFVAIPAAAQAAPVNLATASPFAVLGGQAATNTGPSVLNGDLGVAPGTSLPGFGLPAVVNGATHNNDAVANQAQADLTNAYNVAAGQATTADLSNTDLGNRTLTAGTYKYTSDAQLTGPLTLDAQNNPDAQFVFQITSQLTTASASSVLLVNGASPCNVYWQIGSSAVLGSTTAFQGNLMALTSISLNNGATVIGRVLARNGTVSLINNVIDGSQCRTGSKTPPPSGTTPPPSGPDVTRVGVPAEVRVEGLFSMTISARDPDDAINGVAVDFGNGEEYRAELACRRKSDGSQPRSGPFAPGTPVDVVVPYNFVRTGMRAVTVDVTSGACNGPAETTRKTVLVVVLPRLLLPSLPVTSSSRLAVSARGCPNADLRPARGRMGRMGTATLCLLNVQRAAHGLPPLRANRRLRAAAITHSLDMVRHGYFGHEALGGLRLSSRVIRARYTTRGGRWTLGENIGAGTGRLSTARQMVAAWMRSPPHRANVLSGGFRDVGVGPVLGVPGRRSGHGATYTTDFGRRG